MVSKFKKDRHKIALLTDINMLLMVEEDIRSRITHTVHWYVKANNKHMKNYDKNKESSDLIHLDANNLY